MAFGPQHTYRPMIPGEWKFSIRRAACSGLLRKWSGFSPTTGISLFPPLPAIGSAEPCAASIVDELAALWQTVRERLPGVQIVQNNIESPEERVLGNLDALLLGSAGNVLRAVNLRLAERAGENGVYLFDWHHLASEYGLRRWHNRSYWHYSKHPYPPDLTGAVGFRVARVAAALRGGAKKLLIVDLDNTLWGGVVGDDGVEGLRLGTGAEGEAFSEFQQYLKFLSLRGVVLAVASKNNEDTAMLPFREHPGMRLSLEDIAVFKANWNNKADSIREIVSALNLGLDSAVFLDDNPAERALVRKELPMVSVPELPADPSEFISFLYGLGYFETPTFSSEDTARNRMYKENAERSQVRIAATDIGQYLTDLDMVGGWGEADEKHLPRMAQLINKSNQFHPTTTRYSESRLRAMMADSRYALRWFTLRDRFGDYGLIAAVVLERDGDALRIDTWAMSCRVLERGMEEYIFRNVCALACRNGQKKVLGTFIPTRKNALVAGLYDRLGFEQTGERDGTTQWEYASPCAERATRLFIHQICGDNNGPTSQA